MSDLPHETEFRPSVLKDAVRHRPWMLMLLTLVMGAAAAGGAIVLPGPRESTAVVLVNPLYGNPFSTEGQGDQLTNLETEAQLVATDAVGAIAAKNLGLAVSPTELARMAHGSVTTNTQVIKIVYSADDPPAARARAQAFAEAFLEYRRLRAKTLVDGQLKLLQEQEKTTRDQLVETTQKLADQPEGSAARTLAVEQVRTHTSELTRLTSAIAQQSAIPLDPGQVISPASQPEEDRLLRMLMFGFGGAFVGFVLAFLTAITRERLDDRVRDVSDLDRLSLPWLGSLHIRALWSFSQGEVSEDQRRMRTAVMGALPSLPAVLVVARPDNVGPAPASVERLAVALARSSVRVCLVNTVAASPVEWQIADQDNAGLAGVLLYNVPIADVVDNVMRDFAVVPPGRWTGVVSDLLGNARMRGAIEWLRANHDVVLISAPSLQTADGQMLARLGDGVLLESTVLHTTNAQVLQAIDQLSRANVPVLGSVLVSAASPRLLRRVKRKSRQPGRGPSPLLDVGAPGGSRKADQLASPGGDGGRPAGAIGGQSVGAIGGQSVAAPLNSSVLPPADAGSERDPVPSPGREQVETRTTSRSSATRSDDTLGFPLSATTLRSGERTEDSESR